MTTRQKAGKLELWFVLFISLASLVALTLDVTGVPQGASIVTDSNFTEPAPTNPPSSRADDGGTITYVTLNSDQQNNGWKAYVGNVSGRLTLDDSSGNTIYDWTISAENVQGEVYVSRNNSITWSNISCAVISTITNEEGVLNIDSTAADSINKTFNYTNHSQMQVGVNNIARDTCRSTATYTNDTRQTVSNASVFQEILLQDENSVMVYATFIDQDQGSYKTDNTTYDFQLLVAEDDTAGTPSTYYFYLEIS